MWLARMHLQNSAGDMLCAGILPVNQMRDYLQPAAVIASRVPRHLLEAAYGMRVERNLDIKDDPDRPPTGSEMLWSVHFDYLPACPTASLISVTVCAAVHIVW